jgi:hypothetical protein
MDTARDELAASHNQHLLNGDSAAMAKVIEDIAANRLHRQVKGDELEVLKSQAGKLATRLNDIIEQMWEARKKLVSDIANLDGRIDALDVSIFSASNSRQIEDRIRVLKVDSTKPVQQEPKPIVYGGVTPQEAYESGYPISLGPQPNPKEVEHVIYGKQETPIHTKQPV